jgi:HD-like signal output (HDOD) protein
MAIDVASLKQPKVNEQCLKVLDLISSDDVEIKSLSNAISEDPVLSATLIRYANAPMYRRMIEVTNVVNAINLLGMKNVRLAVYVATMKAGSGVTTPAIDMLWQHSFSVSALSKMIAKKVYPRLADDIELTGLMHDMGALVLADNFPDEYEKLAAQAIAENIPFERAEQEFFGITHDDVLNALLDEIRLPEITRESLQGFHSREPLTDIKTVKDRHVTIVALAHLLEQDVYSATGHPVEEIPESLDTLQMILGLSTDDVQNLVEDYETLLNEKLG